MRILSHFTYRPDRWRQLVWFCVLLLCCATVASAQDKQKLYDPEADAMAQVDEAVHRAEREQKHVLIQVGGNWCSWCRKLDRTMSANRVIDSLLQTDYVLLRVNYSKENRNMDVMERLAWPQRFGFPVLVVLDGEGTRLHTQDSGLLEKNGGHDPEAVARFLKLWSPSALAAESYRK
ncbi:thioredoxin family protein [bacterium]|nr:thioredoxin family protein [bacterium]